MSPLYLFEITTDSSEISIISGKNDKNLQTNVRKEDILNVEFRGQHSAQEWGDVGRHAGRPSRLIVLKSLDLGIVSIFTYRM